jgi:hypothetical protein
MIGGRGWLAVVVGDDRLDERVVIVIAVFRLTLSAGIEGVLLNLQRG